MKLSIRFRIRNQAFTLIEIMIALAVSGILIVGLTRLYSISIGSYTLQEQLTEMNQNAKFVMREITDVLTQAGADCMAINSDSLDRDTLIRVSSESDFFIKVNPRGGIEPIPADMTLNTTSNCSLQVNNANRFRAADSIGKIPNPATSLTRAVQRYKLERWDPLTNQIFISGGVATDVFKQDDVIYSFRQDRYYLNGTNLCLNCDTNVLAENIDSFKVFFKTKTGAITTDWRTMFYDSFVVCAKTSQPDYKYNNPPLNDHYRRIWLINVFRMKNKV